MPYAIDISSPRADSNAWRLALLDAANAVLLPLTGLFSLSAMERKNFKNKVLEIGYV